MIPVFAFNSAIWVSIKRALSFAALIDSLLDFSSSLYLSSILKFASSCSGNSPRYSVLNSLIALSLLSSCFSISLICEENSSMVPSASRCLLPIFSPMNNDVRLELTSIAFSGSSSEYVMEKIFRSSGFFLEVPRMLTLILSFIS